MQTAQFENERWSRGSQSEEFRHREALDLVEGDSVLDMGCGDGLFLSKVDGSEFQRYGVDISSVAIQKLKEKGIDGTAVDFANEPLTFPDGHFSTVVTLDVLEHLFFPERALAEALRVSGECVIVGVPNFSSLPARIAVLFGKVPENNRPKKGHCYWFNLPALRRVVEMAGGRIEVMRVNTFWEHRFFIGGFMKVLVRIFPSLFALSFVVQVRKK